MVLPSVSLVHVERGTVLSCDDFQLIGKSTIDTESVIILSNNTLANQVEAVFDIQKQIKVTQPHHYALPSVSSNDVDKIITILEQTKNKSFSNIIRTSLKHSLSAHIYLIIIINIIIIVLMGCFCRGWINFSSISRLIVRNIPTKNVQSVNQNQDVDLHDYYQQQLKRKQTELSNNID